MSREIAPSSQARQRLAGQFGHGAMIFELVCEVPPGTLAQHAHSH